MAITWATRADALCRVIVAQDSPPPVIDPAQSVLLVYRHNVPVGQTCSPSPPDLSMPDLGSGGDVTDAGSPDAMGWDLSTRDLAGPDLASSGDLALSDAGSCDSDAGFCSDAGAPPDLAPACKDRLGDAITMVVQPQFSTGPAGARFAMLMVTPALPTISLAPHSLFHDLAVSTAPAVDVVDKYVEDPSLGYQCNDPKYGSSGGGGGPGYTAPNPTVYDAGVPDAPFTLGGYEIAVLANAELTAVKVWLDQHGYAYTRDDVAALTPYLAHGWTVTAVRVATDHSLQHHAALALLILRRRRRRAQV